MIYINCKRGRDVETVAEYTDLQRQDARNEIKEYRLSDSSASYYFSSRCCKAWRDDPNKPDKPERSSDTYRIIMFVFQGKGRTIKRGLTLDEAQAICRDPETSSSTCKSAAAKRRTAAIGRWFYGYEKE